MCHIFFIHSSVDGHLGCFHVLAVASSAAVSMGVHVSFRIRAVPRYMSRSGKDGSYGNSILSLFLRNLHAGISLEGLMLKLKLQYFGHLM